MGDFGEFNTQYKYITIMDDLMAYAYVHCSHFPKRYTGTYTFRVLTMITLASECVGHASDIKIDYKYWKYGKTDATYELYRKAYQKRQDFFEDAISYMKTAAKLLTNGKRMKLEYLIKDKDLVLKEFLRQILEETEQIRREQKQDQKAFKRFSIAFGKDFAAY